MTTPTEVTEPEQFDDEHPITEDWDDPDLRNPCPKGTINYPDDDVQQVAAALGDAVCSGGLSKGYYRKADDALKQIVGKLERAKAEAAAGERARLAALVVTCDTCEGDGIVLVIPGNDPDEEEPTTCGRCDGLGVCGDKAAIAAALVEAREQVEDALAEARAEVLEEEAAAISAMSHGSREQHLGRCEAAERLCDRAAEERKKAGR